MQLNRRIPNLYLQILSYMVHRSIHGVIHKRHVDEAINRVIYRTSVTRMNHIIHEFIEDFKVLKSLNGSERRPVYKLMITASVKKQLDELNGKNPFPFSFT